MALLNQSCIIHYGEKGLISRYILKDSLVYVTVWDKNKGIMKNGVLAKGIDDIKACADSKGCFYLFCLNISGDIDVFSIYQEERIYSQIRIGGSDILLRDIRPYISGKNCELLISHSKQDNRNERLLSKYTISTEELNKGNRYPDYVWKDLMEYETFGPVDELVSVKQEGTDNIVISVIEKNEDSNSLILLRDNRFGYVEGLIKISMENEIFWHDIMAKEDRIIIVYTVREGMGFSIKAMVYCVKDYSLSKEYTVRRETACSHPTIIDYKNDIWVCWYENGAVHSCVMNDIISLENYVKWKDSASYKLMCAHIIKGENYEKDLIKFNSRKAFVTYPGNVVTGFGRSKF